MKLFKMIGCLMAVVVTLFLWCNNSEAKDIVIGYTGPLSGPAAEYGQECANGLDMAVKQVNATGARLKARNMISSW
jgi:branched-chain amino acid transport system substrate-binding protein